jgi:hypothetical protein
MNEFKASLSKGIFDPAVVKDLSEAFEKAEKLIDRSIPGDAPALERENVARLILAEARSGETQPDLVACVAVGKALLERQSRPSKSKRERDGKAPRDRAQGQRGPRARTADLPSAGPHAAPNHTNEDATPGTGALPSAQPGDDVDPATG